MQKPMNIMITGAKGSMGKIIGNLASQMPDVNIVPFSLSGHKTVQGDFVMFGDKRVNLIPYDQRANFRSLVAAYEPFTVIDFTKDLDGKHNKAMFENARLYVKNGWDFVMGGTGGDVKGIESLVSESQVSAIVSSNMQPRVVALQRAMADVGVKLKDHFVTSDIYVEMIESHQSGKGQEPSGTMDAIRTSLNATGIKFQKSDIKMIRTPDQQTMLGVPEEYHSGHGWHRYIFATQDRSLAVDEICGVLESNLEHHRVFSGDDRFVTRAESIKKITSNPSFYLDKVPAWVNAHASSRDMQREFIVAPNRTVAVSFEYLPNSYLSIEHNINGRTAYGPAAFDCVRYLINQPKSKTLGRVLTVADVFGIE